MAFSKADQFDPTDIELAEFAKALAHPARIAILRVLAQRQTCICGEIVEAMPIAQATVSQHLKELKNAGLIIGEADGPRSCYCINWDRLTPLWARLQALLNQLQASGCCS